MGLGVVLTAALNGIAVVRAYLRLFGGARHVSTVALNIGLRERIAVLTLTALILGGGIYPQPGIQSRYRAAVEVLNDRNRRGLLDEPTPDALLTFPREEAVE
jgi:NADH-quinone oxidoreductase subunit M